MRIIYGQDGRWQMHCTAVPSTEYIQLRAQSSKDGDALADGDNPLLPWLRDRWASLCLLSAGPPRSDRSSRDDA